MDALEKFFHSRADAQDSLATFMKDLKKVLIDQYDELDSAALFKLVWTLVWKSKNRNIRKWNQDLEKWIFDFCNEARASKDGGIFRIKIPDEKYRYYFHETANSMRKFTHDLSQWMNDYKQYFNSSQNFSYPKGANISEFVHAFPKENVQNEMFQSLHSILQDASSQLNSREISNVSSFWTEENNILKDSPLWNAIYSMVLDFISNRSDDATLDSVDRYIANNKKYHIGIRRIPAFSTPDLPTDHQKIYNFIVNQKIRAIPETVLIKVNIQSQDTWLLIKHWLNSAERGDTYDFWFFANEPSSFEIESFQKRNDSIDPSVRLTPISENNLLIKTDVYTKNVSDYNLFPARTLRTIHPEIINSAIIAMRLTMISLTCPEHIVRQAYELCGLDYRDYQYRREETKINDRATPRKNDGLDDWRVIRYYPYQDRSKRNQEVRQWVQHLAEGERKSEASGKSPVAHKVLLRAKKKPDGTIQSYRPTPRYQEIAKELGFELGKWIQLFDTNEVIYPENIAEMLQILEKETVEDAVDFLNEWIPKDQPIAAIRYETVAVPQQTSPETQEVIDIVYARVRHITDRNRFSELDRKS